MVGLSQTQALEPASQPQYSRVTAALAQHHGIAARAHGRQVNHCGGLHGAGAGIDHGRQRMLEQSAYVLRVIEGFGLAWRYQGGGQ